MILKIISNAENLKKFLRKVRNHEKNNINI